MAQSSHVEPIGRSRRARPIPEDPYRNTGTPREAVIYVRVSTEEQAQGYSLEAQERECREYLEGYKPNWTLVRVFRDEHSGGNDDRPMFQEMMRMVYDQRAKAIVAHRLDRFSRNLHQILTYFKELEAMGVVMAFAKDQFDFSTEEGRLQFHILAMFADWYLRNLSRETKKGKLERVLKGRHNNQPPFGYVATAGGVAEADPRVAPVIPEIFELYASGGYTDARIAKHLNHLGHHTRFGRVWTKDSVRELLQNEFYTGVVKHQGDLYAGEHQAIVPQELFQLVQEIRKQHARRPVCYGTTKRVFLLSGLAHCASCGRTARGQGKLNVPYGYYRETSELRGYSDCPHSGRSVREQTVQWQLGLIMTRFMLPETWQAELRRHLEHTDRAQQMRSERERLQRRLRRVGELYADGVYERPAYDEERLRIQRQLEQLVVVEPEGILEAGMHLECLADVWPQADEDEQQQLCRLLLKAVYIDFAARRIVRLVPQRDFEMLFDYHPFLSASEEVGLDVLLPPALLRQGDV